MGTCEELHHHPLQTPSSALVYQPVLRQGPHDSLNVDTLLSSRENNQAFVHVAAKHRHHFNVTPESNIPPINNHPTVLGLSVQSDRRLGVTVDSSVSGINQELLLPFEKHLYAARCAVKKRAREGHTCFYLVSTGLLQQPF